MTTLPSRSRRHQVGLALAGSGLARASGLVMAIVIAGMFGANSETDAFYLALGVTLYAFEVLRISFEGAVIPTLTGLLDTDRKAAEAVVGRWVRQWVLWASVPAAIAFVAGSLASRYATGLPREALEHGAVLVPLIVPLGLTALGHSLAAAQKRFLLARATGSARPLAAILGAVILHDSLGLWSVVTGYAAGVVVELGMLAVAVQRSGFRLRWAGTLADLKGQLALAGPILVGSVLLNLNPLVDRIVAAGLLTSGSVTVYENAARLFGALTSLVYGSVGVVLVRHWSELHARVELDELARSFRRLTRLTVWGVAPASVLLALVSSVPIRLALGHGEYTAGDVVLTARGFGVLALGIAPFFLAAMGSRLLYAMAKTRVAVTVAFVAVPTNLILDLVLAAPLGVVGVCLSTSVTYAVVAVVVMQAVQRQLRASSQAARTWAPTIPVADGVDP